MPQLVMLSLSKHKLFLISLRQAQTDNFDNLLSTAVLLSLSKHDEVSL